MTLPFLEPQANNRNDKLNWKIFTRQNQLKDSVSRRCRPSRFPGSSNQTFGSAKNVSIIGAFFNLLWCGRIYVWSSFAGCDDRREQTCNATMGLQFVYTLVTHNLFTILPVRLFALCSSERDIQWHWHLLNEMGMYCIQWQNKVNWFSLKPPLIKDSQLRGSFIYAYWTLFIIHSQYNYQVLILAYTSIPGAQLRAQWCYLN